MEGYSQHWMYVKREQILKSSHSHLEAVPVGDDNNNYSWEERAFAEDSTRILGGSMWPPRSYSCTFCKREFRSAQALGGHMNIHRRDRARLKQNRIPHNYQPLYHHHHHHKNDFKSLLGNNHFSAPEIISTQIDCGLMSAYSSPATTITTTRLSSISTQENCGQHNFSPCSSEQEDYNFNYDYVETSLSVGVNSMCGQKSSPSCKRLKTSISSPEEIPLGRLNHGMEDLDLELRLGKQQKVK